MADFCAQCADAHGFPNHDVHHLDVNEVEVFLCEGCGWTVVDHTGQCIANCLEKHGTIYVKTEDRGYDATFEKAGSSPPPQFPADFAGERKPSPHYHYKDEPMMECPLCAGHSYLVVHSREIKIARSAFCGHWVGYVMCNSCSGVGPFSVHQLGLEAEAQAVEEWNR